MTKEQIAQVWQGQLLNCDDDCEHCGEPTVNAVDGRPCCKNCA